MRRITTVLTLAAAVALAAAPTAARAQTAGRAPSLLTPVQARLLAERVRQDSAAAAQWARFGHTAPDTGFVYGRPPAAWLCGATCRVDNPDSLRDALEAGGPAGRYWLAVQGWDWLSPAEKAAGGPRPPHYLLRASALGDDAEEHLLWDLAQQGFAPAAVLQDHTGPVEGAVLTLQAARAGWAPAMYAVAGVYQKLHDGAVDERAAAQLKTRLPAPVDPQHPGTVWLRRAMAAGYPPAYVRMATWIREGQDGYPRLSRRTADSIAGDLIARSSFPLLAYRLAASIDSGAASGAFTVQEGGQTYTDALLPARIYQDLARWGMAPAARRMFQFCQHDWEMWGSCPDRIWRWRRAIALAGDTASMLWLARARDTGVGAPQDSAAALAWYVKAARAGAGLAWAPIAIHLERGAGVRAVSAHAALFYARGVKAGDPLAMERLGERLLTGGGGVRRDTLAALAMFAGSLEPYLARAGKDDPVAIVLQHKGILPVAARDLAGLTDSTRALGCYTCRSQAQFNRLFATALYHTAAFLWRGWKRGALADTASLPWVADMLRRSQAGPVLGRGSPAALYARVRKAAAVRAGRAVLATRKRNARKSAFEAAMGREAAARTQKADADAQQEAAREAAAAYRRERAGEEARKNAYWQGVFQSLRSQHFEQPESPDEDDLRYACSETWTSTLHYRGSASTPDETVQIHDSAPVVCGGGS